MELYRGEVKIEAGKYAGALYKALLPEEKTPPSHRSKFSVKMSGGEVRVYVVSSDLASFRAAVNSVLRLIGAVESLGEDLYTKGTHSFDV